MKKIYTATLHATATEGEYSWIESSECEYGEAWDGDVTRYLLNIAEDEGLMQAMIDREYIGAIHNLPEGAIVLAAENGTPLEIWWATEFEPKRISLDNGVTYYDAEEAAEALKDAANSGIGWDEIVSYMDDALREWVHNELAPCAEAEFLQKYLEWADADLIVG